ncbi:MAG: hypothetical protein ABSH41_32730 [Syntrophobacteraceae bacterium]
MVNRAARAPREDLAVKGPAVAVAVVVEAVAVVVVAAAAVVEAADSGWLPITRIASIEMRMKTPNL